MEILETRLLSSLSKVFADEHLEDMRFSSGSMLTDEKYSFQVAYNWNGSLQKNVTVKITSDIDSFIEVKSVDLAPSEMPCYANHDDNILRDTPGLYPDILNDISSKGITLLPNQWRSLWITINGNNTIKQGVHRIKIAFINSNNEEFSSEIFNVNIIGVELPKQELINTNWFHCDCISTYYGVEVFSSKHWHLLKKYIKTAVDNGMNMILTPIFTPPLDTEVGGERPTVQLVDVYKQGDIYTFKYNKLKKWIDVCQEVGIEYFEISHLFTQWGAKYAPKIVGIENEKLVQLFGWNTEAVESEYENFLSQFLPSLINFINETRISDKCYFHISDEPNIKQIESYKSASNLLSKYVNGFPIIDALSNYEFYKNGMVKNPIPATNEIGEFLENNVPNLWTYYCCAQHIDVSNRFFNMPSARNRILGVQLYKFNIAGFLHWGYNFWYSQYSLFPIDPYRVTDAAHGFPSGDAFVVYPGEDGPIESLRLKVFNEALQDLRALSLLESYIGRDAVIGIIDRGLEKPITFSYYPKEKEWLLDKRQEINRLIAEYRSR